VESLALFVLVVLVAIFTVGLPSVFFAIRTPTSRFGRAMLLMLAPLSFSAGVFMFVRVVTAFRLFGLGFAAASVISVVRLLRAKGVTDHK
jgi:hypothetical protein